MLKKHTCSNTIFVVIFNDFDLPKWSPNWAFSATFWTTSILWKSTKTIEKPMVFADFSRFDPPQNDPKIFENRQKIRVRRGLGCPGVRSGSYGGPQGRPRVQKYPKMTFAGPSWTPLWETIFDTFQYLSVFFFHCFFEARLQRLPGAILSGFWVGFQRIFLRSSL